MIFVFPLACQRTAATKRPVKIARPLPQTPFRSPGRSATFVGMLHVAVIGLGPIGLAAAKSAQRDPNMKLSALVDVDPAKLGRRLVDLDPTADADDVAVVADLDDTPAPIDVAILCTGSHFDRIAPNLRQLMKRKCHVVSSCEEMTWPWLRHPHLADVIAGEARAAGVALCGTGVNPGFVMDFLPVVLSSMVTKVTHVKVTRVVDVLTRRLPLQRKVGSGMTTEKFKELAKAGRIGHQGIGESVTLLAQGLGRHPRSSEVFTTLRPVIADREIDWLAGTVQPGQVCGMYNTGRWEGGGLTIELELTMALASQEPRDEILLTADRNLHLLIPGSTPGDTATVASLVNVARQLPRTTPGLKTMLDLPACGCMS